MNKNQYIQPLFVDETSSCLTNQDLLLAGVTAISVHLKNLLLRPGIDFLSTQDIRKYLAWDKQLVLNCSSLSCNAKNEFQIVSEIDGSKHTFSYDAILELIDILDVDVVIYPEGLANLQSPKYLSGSFDLEFLVKLRKESNLFIENHKPSADGYNGVFYRDMYENSILDSIWEFEFTVLDNNCQCYTCSSGYTCAYLHHLLKNTPLLAQRLLISHNVFYINHLP